MGGRGTREDNDNRDVRLTRRGSRTRGSRKSRGTRGGGGTKGARMHRETGR